MAADLTIVSDRSTLELKLAAIERRLKDARLELEAVVLDLEGRGPVSRRSRLRGAIRQVTGWIQVAEASLERLGTAA